MAKKDQIHRIFDSLVITDIAEHISEVSDCRDAGKMTIMIKSSLNQTVSLTFEGSDKETFDLVLSIKSGVSIASGVTAYQTLTDFMPFIRAKAQCSVAPGAGNLIVSISKYRGR
jgi:hypothetical protein